MQHFKFINKQDLLYLTKIRRFETKLGELIQVLQQAGGWEAQLQNSTASYVIVGIPEDIGVRANKGVGGADTAWIPFLQSLLNLQSNDFLMGNELLLLGHFDFGDIQYLIDTQAHSEEEKLEAYRHAVTTIDDEVEAIVKIIASAGKIPVVIGGGHNNAYPLIKGVSKGLYKSGKIPLAQINVINLDAHADLRPLEGRHSGNAFTYASEDGYLQKYCVVGLQESYIPQNVWVDIVNNPFIDCITYEDIYIHEKRHFLQAVAHATGFTEDTYTGIELDLDAITDILSSAHTPAGIPVTDARRYLNYVATDSKAAYLHICEGAARLNDGRTNPLTGKLISLLVADFIKAHIEASAPR